MTRVPVQIIWHKLARNVCFGWRSPPIDATLYLIVFIIFSGEGAGIDSGHPWPSPCGRPAAVPIRSRRIGRTWRLRTYTLFQKKGAPDGTLLFLAVQRVMCKPCSVDSLAIFRIPGAICSCPFGDIAGNLAARRPLRRAPVPNTPARRMTPIIGSIRRQGSYFGWTVRLCDPIVGSSRLKVPRVPRPLSLMLTASRFPGKSI